MSDTQRGIVREEEEKIHEKDRGPARQYQWGRRGCIGKAVESHRKIVSAFSQILAKGQSPELETRLFWANATPCSPLASAVIDYYDYDYDYDYDLAAAPLGHNLSHANDYFSNPMISFGVTSEALSAALYDGKTRCMRNRDPLALVLAWK